MLLDELLGAARLHVERRVQVAVLTRSDGQPVTLRRYITDAHVDDRDVLAWPEYPAHRRSRCPGATSARHRRAGVGPSSPLVRSRGRGEVCLQTDS